jgi:quinol-cytochrome oxidoreductase complex cytochrome b subunit
MKIRVITSLFPSFISNHAITYPTPININYFWSFGALAFVCLFLQLLTGIFLAMHYVPHIDFAFESVEHIMRDVNGGALMRYLHANGASMFFFITYLHIFKGFYYGSYLKPSHLLWCVGVIIFLCMMATAFLGYVLPWGQMSLWGATVITNLFSAIPIYGNDIVSLLWGGFSVDQATLNRFFSIHYLLPFLIIGLTCIHIGILHSIGSNNPLGIYSMTNISFHPYFTVKDFFVTLGFFIFIFYFLFFNPNILGHPDNYILANSMVTPAHIVPEWYFLPFYAILRSIPNKLGGVVAMVSAILCWILLPFIATHEFRSTRFRPFGLFLIGLIIANFILLGWIGQQPIEQPYVTIGFFSTLFYFISLLVLLPGTTQIK